MTMDHADGISWQIVLAIARCVYLLYFHPLAKFPGPKIAAVSDVRRCASKLLRGIQC